MAAAKKVLTTYLRRLTNLAANSRSLLLLRLPQEQFIDLHELSHLNGENSFSIIEALITRSKKTVCAVNDAHHAPSNEASRKLKKIQRLDQFIFEESGAKDLHIGWPMVEGKFNDGTMVRCPLLYFPVELMIEGSKWVIKPREDTTIQFNKSFLLSYAYYNELKADESLLEETFEDGDQDSTVFRTQLYHLLQKSTLEIHFNPDNYRDELNPFPFYKKEEFESLHPDGKLKLFPHAVMGIFPQAGSYLVPDYLHLINRPEFTDVESLLQSRHHTLASLNFLTDVKEDKVYPVFPMDIWQENALKGIKIGHSLVIQGPPGTGKSQLICNLISDAIAQGRRILVVCQKRAALDVVYQRMMEEGMADFLALVHDFKNDRKDIFEKIGRQINKVDEFRSKNNSLDTIYLERTFLHSSRRIDQITEELEEFRTSLFDEQECGRSIKELYLHSNPQEPSINLKQELSFFPFTQIDDFLRKLKAYAHYASTFLQDNYPWRDRKSFSKFTISDLAILREFLIEIPEVFRQTNFKLDALVNQKLDLDQWLEIAGYEKQIHELTSLFDRPQVYEYFQRVIDEPEEETSSLWLSNIERVVNECFSDAGPEISVTTAQLGQFQEALHRSLKARKSLIGLVRWELFSKDKFLIQRALVSNGLPSNKHGFLTLEAKLDSRLNLEHNLSKLRARSWLADLPESYQLEQYRQWFGLQLMAIHAKELFLSMRGMKSLLHPQSITSSEFCGKLLEILKSVTHLKERYEKWKNVLTPTQIKSITTSDNQIQILKDIIQRDFDALCEFDRLKEGFSEAEKNTIEKLYEAHPSGSFEVLQKLFLNSLSLAWIEHLENKHPELRKATSGQIMLLENELREQIITKQKISAEILLMKARESVIADLEFNRLNNRVTYRDLLHQVTKKKKIWPIRKLISEFEPEIFKLLPCWLASPESVSAIFPMKEIFDLVIFDEASQCFAERGIPSLFRGRQTVVAGDSKQLRPGDFYQVRWEEESDDHPDQEVDSLLDLAARYWQTLQLRGHYRSRTPELIEFSNQHFYDQKLQLLPDYKFNRLSPPIEYRKVEGLWKNNTNEVEAIAAARCVREIAETEPGSSIGIVTFNTQQQSLVHDFCEDIFLKEGKKLPESLFVKNIENVQGDERDVIIFSIGYAPDQKNKIHAQFGSLNVAGGENRLNVAITRARKKVIIISSIWPQQLQTEETKNPGPKLLKEYLAYAKMISDGNQYTRNNLPAHHSKNWYLNTKVVQWASGRWPAHSIEQSALQVFDIVIKEKEEPRGVLLLDDDLYFSDLSAKAPHGLSPILLEAKGWPFIRAYSRNYWMDSEKFFLEISKLFIITG